jgi:hypothetical protein
MPSASEPLALWPRPPEPTSRIGDDRQLGALGRLAAWEAARDESLRIWKREAPGVCVARATREIGPEQWKETFGLLRAMTRDGAARALLTLGQAAREELRATQGDGFEASAPWSEWMPAFDWAQGWARGVSAIDTIRALTALRAPGFERPDGALPSCRGPWEAAAAVGCRDLRKGELLFAVLLDAGFQASAECWGDIQQNKRLGNVALKARARHERDAMAAETRAKESEGRGAARL